MPACTTSNKLNSVYDNYKLSSNNTKDRASKSRTVGTYGVYISATEAPDMTLVINKSGVPHNNELHIII